MNTHLANEKCCTFWNISRQKNYTLKFFKWTSKGVCENKGRTKDRVCGKHWENIIKEAESSENTVFRNADKKQCS